MPSKTQTGNKQSNRRREPRLGTWFNTSFQAGNQCWLSGFARDISAKGMRILTLEPLQPGAQTAIILENIAEEENVLITGKVVWQINSKIQTDTDWIAPSMGIEFDQILPVKTTAFVH